MVGRVVITVLCGVGLYTSLFMLRKSIRAARGEVRGPSVVKTPRAHLFGVPNSALGVVYYPAAAAAVWLIHSPWAALALLVVMAGAAATSAFLAYSLLFITRRECPYCWTSHCVNWVLLGISSWIFVPDILSIGT